MFVLKDHQEINNGQEYYNCTGIGDEQIEKLLQIYHSIQKSFSCEIKETVLEYGFTRYPVSRQGSAFHRDFSSNVRCVVTFFFGETSLIAAKNKKEYMVSCGDIIVMRAPRNYMKEEVSMRPVHAIGRVRETLYTFEVREVDMRRRSAIKT
jgi:hypothetical protein